MPYGRFLAACDRNAMTSSCWATALAPAMSRPRIACPRCNAPTPRASRSFSSASIRPAISRSASAPAGSRSRALAAPVRCGTSMPLSRPPSVSRPRSSACPRAPAIFRLRGPPRARAGTGEPAQRLAIGLGCDVAYAPRLIYADGIDLNRNKPVDIGLNCYLCERPDCAARAHAPMNRRLKINERERSLALSFSF